MVRVLVVSHTYIAPINREKWKIFSKQYSHIQFKVLIPKFWPATLFNLYVGDLTKDNSNNCEFIALDTFKAGNEVLYGYKWRELLRFLRSFKPDLIHVEQGSRAFSYFQLIFLSKLFLRKTKFTFFTWINWKPKQSWKYKLIWRFIEKFNLCFSHGAFVGNEDAGNILKDKNFKKPIEVLLQLGVNQKFFKPAKSSSIKTKRYIGYVGRIIEEKGVFILIDAFLEIIKEHRGWELLFVGDGKEKKDLVKYVFKKDLNERVEFRASVPHEKVADILSELEVLVLPSYDTLEWKEQFGHILIEAMACKIPVIGSDAGNIANVICDAGFVFRQKSVSDLAKCLKKLIVDKELRKKMEEKGYQRYKSNFSYQIIADKTYSFWKKI